MSTGFPHDPFHQIVNVQWMPRLITFRLLVNALREIVPGDECEDGLPMEPDISLFWVSSASYRYLGPHHFNPIFADSRPRWWNHETNAWVTITNEADIPFTNLPATPFASASFGEWEYIVDGHFLEWTAISTSFPEVRNIPIPVPGFQHLRFRQTTLAECAFESIVQLSPPTNCYEVEVTGFQVGAHGVSVSGLEFEKRQLELRAIRATYRGLKYKPYAIQRVPDTDLIPPTAHKKWLWVLCRRTAT